MSIVHKIAKVALNMMPYYITKKIFTSTGCDRFQPGGYYSPVPWLSDIKKHNFATHVPPENLSGINLHTEEQLRLLHF